MRRQLRGTPRSRRTPRTCSASAEGISGAASEPSFVETVFGAPSSRLELLLGEAAKWVHQLCCDTLPCL